MTVLGVIPARYHSSRFPGKVLVPIDGIPMVAHVYNQARKSQSLHSIIVAADDQRVFKAMEDASIPVTMTSPLHASGTDRVAEVANSWRANVYVNIQADEPFIDPQVIDAAVEPFLGRDPPQAGTVASTALSQSEWASRDIVKVCVSDDGFAEDFFRTPTNNQSRENCFKHIGLYVYRRDFLLQFASMEKTLREKQRDLEQMRVLDHNVPMKVVLTDYDQVGINTPEDLDRVLEMMALG